MPEQQLIARIRRAAGGAPRAGAAASAGVVCGIGDDCAVLRLPPGHEALVTTDFTLEDVHFRRDWHPAVSVGHRCLTRGLSDIAAMGGEPLAAFLSLALPAHLPQTWVDGFLRGFTSLARKFHVQLAGGDTAQSPGGVDAALPRRRAGRKAAAGKILADIVVLGSVPRGKAVLRSGARIGDDIFVTGSLGAATAVLRRLERSARLLHPSVRKTDARWGPGLAGGSSLTRNVLPALARSARAAAEQKHFFPTPRIAVGRWLRERRLASAMIDISDGLSTDLNHICRESGVGAWIAEAALPIAPGATFEEAIHGGDEYELLFTAPAAKHDRIPDRIAGVAVRWIGTITKPRGLWLVAPEMKSRRQLHMRGWEHFREPSSTR